LEERRALADEGRYAATKPRVIPDWEQRQFHETMQLFSELQVYRAVFAGQWEEAARLVLPTSKNTFYYGSYNFPGQKKTQEQIDASGALALHRFCAIVDSLVTPKNQKWHGLRHPDRNVMKDRGAKLWYEQINQILFDQRYEGTANFAAQNYNSWQSVGCFGNSTLYCDALDARWNEGLPGFRYRGVPLGETFYGENHQGQVTTMVRWFRGTAEQAVQKWGIAWLPPIMRPALEKNMQTPFDFLHCVRPRGENDYDPERLDERGKPFESYYISIQGQCLMGPESGYRVFPFTVSRYDQTPGEVYGRGPVQIVLPALKTLNAQKSAYLKQAHRNADPVLLMPDDGIVSFNMVPGANNFGAVTADGKPLVHTLPIGNMQVSIEAMQEERGIVDDTLLVSLFKVLTEHPDMTATQVIQLVNEKSMLVAPTLGRQHDEKVVGLVRREISLGAELGMFPPAPPILREAGVRFQVVDTSPLAMAARAGEAAGFMRAVEFARQIAVDTQDPGYLDRFDFDAAIPEIAEINNSPIRWMADDRKVQMKRKSRADNAAREQQIQAMPAQAAFLKAQAAMTKAGGVGQQPPQGASPQGALQ
jgi:hypothetical protein